MAKRSEEVQLSGYAGKFVFEGLAFRKLRNGHKIRVTLEAEFDDEAMGQLAALLEKHVDVSFAEYVPEKKADPDEEQQEKIKFDSSQN
jgi:hypothetical protein